MIGILVVSHEPLGTALIHCTRHIFGRMPPQLAALDVIPDEDPDQALCAARELLKRINDGSGVIVLTDLFGGTPSNLAISLLDAGHVEVIAGINLPMLIRLAGARKSMDVTAAVHAAQTAGRNYITIASELLGQDTPPARAKV